MESNDKQEILGAISELTETVNSFATNVQGQFEELEVKMDKRFEKVESEIGIIKNSMVTKTFLEDKMLEYKGEIIAMVKGGDSKVNSVIETLEDKNVINKSESKRLISLSPFPQIKT